MRNSQSYRACFVLVTVIFALGWAITIVWCRTMSAMGGMAMPGEWSMSGLRAAASCLGMWTVMTIAMMSPSLAAMLWRYGVALGGQRVGPREGRLMLVVALGYLTGWSLLGVAVLPLGVALASLEMSVAALARAVPLATGAILLGAGALQFTQWKLHQLRCCRNPPGGSSAPNARAAWRYGLRLSAHCIASCAGATAVLLVVGMMNLRAMAAVTVAVTLERLAREGERMARLIGVTAVGFGMGLLALAAIKH